MQLIYNLTILSIGVTFSLGRAQLLYTDPSRDDGPCRYPSPVPLLNANLLNPFRTYYIPFASENFYRFEYNMATNHTAQTELDVTSLQTRVYVSGADIFLNLAPIAVSFFGTRDVHYSYRLVPALNPSSLLNPLFDYIATAVHGSSGTGPTGFAGRIVFTVIWNDASPAYNVYTCVGGRQMFHIISGAPSLTDDQMKVNNKILVELGFSPANFQYLKY